VVAGRRRREEEKSRQLKPTAFPVVDGQIFWLTIFYFFFC